MSRITITRVAALLLASFATATAAAQDAEDATTLRFKLSSADVEMSGFVYVDYGYGDRFPDNDGNDSFGISRVGLRTEIAIDDFSLVTLLGGRIESTANAKTDFEEIYIRWREVAGTEWEIRAGAAPLLFGMNSAGFSGDRSIVPSLEFGGAGGFAVSNQEMTGIGAEFPLELGRLQVALFDTDTGGGGDGSSLFSNGIAQFRFDELPIENTFGYAGVEWLYNSGDQSDIIVAAGVGYKADTFSLTVEAMLLDAALVGTAEDEMYLIGEFTMDLGGSDYRIMADYATAIELDSSTLRVGVSFIQNDNVTLQFEYAADFQAGTTDVDSLHARMHITF